MRNILKTVLTFVILAALVVIALRILGMAIAIVLPIAVIAAIAFVVYILVTGKRS